MNITRRSWLRATAALAAPGGAPGASGYQLHPDHPRLFFRRQPWGPHCLTVDEVRRRGRSFVSSLDFDRPPNPDAAPNAAMRYIITGEEAAGEAAIRHMKRGCNEDRQWTTTQGDQIEEIAIAYDWLRGLYPEFPEADRIEIERILVEGGRRARQNLENGASIYHTRMYAWANAALFAGLALYGERDEAEELADFGIRYYRERLIPARRHAGGAWFNALSYGKKYLCRSVFSMLAAWRSATGEDLWRVAREEEEDWAGNMLNFLMYTLRPDHRFAGYGDIFNSMWESHQGTMRVVAQATSETRDPYGQGFLEEIRRRWGRPCYERHSRWYQVFEDTSIEARPRSELEPSRVFGRNSLGLAVMRSGWGPHDTWVAFKCGDYGDNHGHFDQGHFEIYRRGQLALDHFYWSKATRFHNTILVNDPADPHDEGNQREFSRQNHSTLKSYLADEVVETGDITDYRDDRATTYVRGDVTAAYDRAKVESFTRQLVFVERRYLVILDFVKVTDPRLRRRFLIHYPTKPSIAGRHFRWVNGGGQLITHTVLPHQARIAAIPTTEAGRSKIARRFKEYWPAGCVEVEPAAYDSVTTVFLHVLWPCDVGDAAPSYQFGEDASSCTLSVGGRTLKFGKDGRSFKTEA